MNEMSDASWFYTREGQQCGPLTLAELRVKAAEGVLNPRHDMVWTQGMTDWKPAGEVDGLFEKREAAAEPAQSTAAPASPAAATPASASPYTPPAEAETMDVLAQQAEWPGARRRSFLLMTMLFPFIWNLGFGLATPLLIGSIGPEITAMVSIGAMLVLFFVIIYFGVQRLANVGMSRWWYLGNLVPILNLWVGYRMFACPAGYAHHKKLDGAGVALAIVYWLMLVVAVLAMIAMFALVLGMAGNPENQQQFEQAIREALNAGSSQ